MKQHPTHAQGCLVYFRFGEKEIKMNSDILWGVGSILLGVFSLWDTHKHPIKGRDIWRLDEKGYIGGIGCIIAGLWFLWDAFHK